jgi:hypothetical protein
MTMTTKTQDLKTLNRLYNEEIDKFEARLDRLEVAFNRRCEEIRTAAHTKLNALPKNDRISRGRVLTEEKKELDQIVRELKTAIRESGRETQKICEKIQSQIDAIVVRLENEINAA